MNKPNIAAKKILRAIVTPLATQGDALGYVLIAPSGRYRVIVDNHLFYHFLPIRDVNAPVLPGRRPWSVVPHSANRIDIREGVVPFALNL